MGAYSGIFIVKNHEKSWNPETPPSSAQWLAILAQFFGFWWLEVEKSTKINIFGVKIDQKDTEELDKHIATPVGALSNNDHTKKTKYCFLGAFFLRFFLFFRDEKHERPSHSEAENMKNRFLGWNKLKKRKYRVLIMKFLKIWAPNFF